MPRQGKTFAPVFAVSDKESLAHSYTEAGGDLGYRLLEPLTLPYVRVCESTRFPALSLCHDVAKVCVP